MTRRIDHSIGIFGMAAMLAEFDERAFVNRLYRSIEEDLLLDPLPAQPKHGRSVLTHRGSSRTWSGPGKRECERRCRQMAKKGGGA